MRATCFLFYQASKDPFPEDPLVGHSCPHPVPWTFPRTLLLIFSCANSPSFFKAHIKSRLSANPSLTMEP